MNIQFILSNLFTKVVSEIKPGAAPHAPTGDDVAKAMFDDMLRKEQAKVAKPELPQRPEPPAKFTPSKLSGQNTTHKFYNAQGRLFQLGRFEAGQAQELIHRLQQMPSQHSGLESNMAQGTQSKINSDVIMATLLAQSFKLIKDELERDNKKPDRFLKSKKRPDTHAEEEALEMLETLLSFANEAESLEAFCDWADETVSHIYQDLERNWGKELPEEVQKRFSILNDALNAMRHGMQPEVIIQKLEEGIE